MKIHTNQFKENVSLIGKQLDSKITYELDGVVQTLASEQLNSITPTFQGAILKSVMKELDLDSNIDIPLGTTINYKFGVLVGNAYEYLDFGNYIVYSSEKQEDYDSYKIVCYDKMLYSMKTNENLGITYPISIRNYIKALCTKIGLEFKNQNETFANYDKMINEELYFGQDYTYRDILDELAQVTASTICLDKNDKVEIRYISNTAVDTIDEKFLKDINVNFGQKYGPVNSIVLSRSAESDNIYLQDEQSVANNGLCEIKIKDNQIMNFNNRSEFLPDILKKLDGLEYYLNDFASTGIAYLELCDRYNIKVFDNTYSCVMFNDELLVTQGLGENVHTDMPEETETDYRKADKEDRKINSAFLIVDKQLGEIRGEVTKVESKVEDITTTTQTSTGGNSLYLKEALESNALEYSIDGKCEQDGTPTPDSPVEIKTIKGIRNLLNLNAPTSTTSGITCTNNNDGSITINGHTTAGFTYYLTNDNITFDKGKKYTISAKVLSGSCTNYTSSTSWAFKFIADINNVNATETNIGSTTKEVEKTFDGTNSSAKPYLWFGWNSSTTDNDAVFNDLRVQFMVEEGDIKHSYVPYGIYEKIKVTGKNIFNIQKWLNATFPVVHGVLNSKTSNSISLTSTADDCYTSTFSMSTITNKTTIDNFGFEIEENTDYTFYTKKSDTIGGTNFVFYFDKDYKYISLKSNNSITNENFLNFTTPPNAKYICFRLGINKSGNTVEFSNIMLLKGTITTTPYYEPYKEKEVLIDLAKENLCNISKWQPYQYSNSLPVSISSNITINSSNNNNINFTINNNLYLYVLSNVFELEPNTTYTISYNRTNSQNITSRYYIYAYENDTYSHIINGTDDNVGKTIIFTTSASGKIAIAFGADNKANNTTCDISNIKVYKGTNSDDSYELNSIGDTKDKLEIVNGVVDIQKRIGKIVLNGSEDWEIGNAPNQNNTIYFRSNKFDNIFSQGNVYSNYFTYVRYLWDNDQEGIYYDVNNPKSIRIRINKTTASTVAKFKTWLSTHNLEIQGILATPETITLPNTNIPLYEGINHVTLVEDLETTTSIKYYRNTPIAQDYVVQQQLDETNSNLSNTDNKVSQAQSDINTTNTNLNNNYYNKEQVDSINSTTTQNITQIRNTMEQNITSTNASISKIQEEITNGVSKVTTTTGTFDENGLNISKSGQQMSSTLDWDGLEVVRDKGKATETEVLTVRSAGVEAENMTVRNFFIKRPIRIEKCKSITDSTKVGLGFFWIGE